MKVQPFLIYFTRLSWLANPFSKYSSDGWTGQPWASVMNPLYEGLNPWIIILRILSSTIWDVGSSSEISRQRSFLSNLGWLSYHLLWLTESHLKVTVSAYHLFLKNEKEKDPIQLLGAYLICSKISSSTLLFMAYGEAFPPFIFHLLSAGASSCGGGLLSLPLTTSQHSWPCCYDSMQVCHVLSFWLLSFLRLPTVLRSAIVTWYSLLTYYQVWSQTKSITVPACIRAWSPSSKTSVPDRLAIFFLGSTSTLSCKRFFRQSLSSHPR